MTTQLSNVSSEHILACATIAGALASNMYFTEKASFSKDEKEKYSSRFEAACGIAVRMVEDIQNRLQD